MPASRKKVNLHQLHRDEYMAPRKPRVITVGKAQYIAICGKGTPGGELFRSHVCTLYAVAYALRIAKKKLGKDFKICPLEGLWREQRPSGGGASGGWDWKLLIRVPTFVRQRDLVTTVAQLSALGRDGGVTAKVKLEQLKEGRCVQVLHVGPCSAESLTIERMRWAAQEAGLAFHGCRHAIYLSDPRRVPPERMRIIMRVPVRIAR